ncbi:phosphoribosyltransferase family protein [Porifericola rhodea]|uniref:phosphoribosyltransferase n=1 Tax=Porifericola rhodea TaxID=930972 RepID=UPI0026659C35|nr:phosphoribosyltransferase family protein [Porifericola rhodea]WKN31490.1 phosphoribosyltransferase family protein [Porifericola rhodea]
MFINRKEAALALGRELMHLHDEKPVVLGIPRGGVVMGKYIHEMLSAPLDVVMTKKISHPENPELAVGAVSMDNEVAVSQVQIPEKYFNDMAGEIRKLLCERYHKYMGGKDRLPICGTTVILVDDGIATGNTMLATIRLVRKQNPRKIVVATPVAPPDVVRIFEEEADEFVVLQTPPEFSAVGQFYEDFHQVSDEQVIDMLNA